MENVPFKIIGSQLTATEFNDGPMTELKNAVTSTGQILTSADLDQLSKSMGNYSTAATHFTDSGIADAYVVNTLAPLKGATAYFQGMTVKFWPLATNTGGAATINVNSLGIKNIKTPFGIDPAPFDIVANYPVELRYDGTDFIIASELSTVTGKASISADQSIPTTTPTIILFDVLSLDRNSGFAANSFTPVIPGVYEVTLQTAVFDLTNATYFSNILLNGVTTVANTLTFENASGETATSTCSGIVALNGTTDFIQGQVQQNDGGNRDLKTTSFMHIHLLRRT